MMIVQPRDADRDCRDGSRHNRVQDSDAADFARCRRLDARFIVGSFSLASTNGGKVIRLVARSTYFAFGWAVFTLSVRFAAVSAISV